MIDSAVTDLPDPDSPTTATVSPRPTENDRSRTAVTTRSAVPNSTLRPSMASRDVGAFMCGFIIAPSIRGFRSRAAAL